MAEAFFDTNVLLYLTSDDAAKADRAEALMRDGGVISVQVLNEFSSVARRKQNVAWPDLEGVLEVFKALLRVEPLTLAVHEKGLALARRYNLGIYDAQILAAATVAGCDIVYSEDMQDGLKADAVTVRNPFAGA